MKEIYLVLAFFAVGFGCFVLGGYIMEANYKKYVKSIRKDYRKIIAHKDAERCRLEAKLKMAKDYMTDLIVTD